MAKPDNVIVDLEDRDPNSLSQHLQVLWDDVIGEPEGIRSPECVWRLSHQCFKHSRNCCYTFLAVLLAPFTAVCLGFGFACISFNHIWCISPCLRMCKISFAATRSFFLACTQAFIIPFTGALGYVFSNINVKTQTISNGPDRQEDPLII